MDPNQNEAPPASNESAPAPEPSSHDTPEEQTQGGDYNNQGYQRKPNNNANNNTNRRPQQGNYNNNNNNYNNNRQPRNPQQQMGNPMMQQQQQWQQQQAPVMYQQAYAANYYNNNPGTQYQYPPAMYGQYPQMAAGVQMMMYNGQPYYYQTVPQAPQMVPNPYTQAMQMAQQQQVQQHQAQQHQQVQHQQQQAQHQQQQAQHQHQQAQQQQQQHHQSQVPNHQAPVYTPAPAPAAIPTPTSAVKPPAPPAAAAPAVVAEDNTVRAEVPSTPSKAPEPVAAPSTPAATPVAIVAPTTAPKRKLVIKNKDGEVIEDLNKWKETVKVEETPVKAAEIPSIPSLPVSIPKPAASSGFPVDIAPQKPVEKAEAAVPEFSTPVKEAPAEGDEKVPSMINSTPDLSASGRRLVPGGKKSLAPGAKATIKRYTRSEIMGLKPEGIQTMTLFGPVTYQQLDTPMQKSGQGRSPNPQQNNNNQNNAPNGGGGGGGWTRSAQPPTPKKKPTPVAPPKAVISDPMKLIELQVTSLLNRLTPENYEKLSKSFLELELKNSAMLDKLVQLIFEKAVQEPNFSAVYAELCVTLKEGGKNWIFFTVVKSVDSGEFFWIKDFVFPAMASGPFFSKNDVFAAEDFGGAMKPFPNPIEGAEYYLKNDTLLRLTPVKSASGDQWFVTYVPFSEVPKDNRSENLFGSAEEATKNGSSSVSFRGSLAHSCEREFQSSVADENLFDEVDSLLKELIATRTTMSDEQFTAREAEIDDKRGKLKRRMLGNIRFVGELYKQKLLNTDTMHDCITQLLGPPGNWKQTHDVQDLELLCRLLTTVGEYLEQKSKNVKKKPELDTNFEAYFDRLYALSKDRTLDARIRFSIEDVIALRKNKWVSRRAAEGPLKISEIHQKMQEEEQIKAQPPARGGDNRGNRPDNRGGGSGDARNFNGNTGSGKGPNNNNNNNNRPPQGGKNDSRGGARPDTRGGRGGHQSAAPNVVAAAAPSSSAAAVETVNLTALDFSDKTMQKKAKSSLDEYMNGEDIGEVKALLKETSIVLVGYLLQDVLERFYTMKEGPKKDRLSEVFNDEELMNVFLANHGIVEAAVEQYEPLKVLVDTTLDAKDAPEQIGAIVNKLVKKGILKLPKIQAMKDKFRELNIEMDYNPLEDIDNIYTRFMSAVSL